MISLRRSLATLALLGFALGAVAAPSFGRVSLSPARALASTTKLTNTSLPQISGEKQVGGKLTTTTGTWSATPTSYAFQWQLCNSSGQSCQPLAGLTTQTIVVPSSAASLRMRVKVTATGASRSASATSHSTMTIAPAPSTQPVSSPPESTSTGSSGVLFADQFSYANGVITNEYAKWNPTSTDAKVSPAWEMTSGSLLAQEGTGWTGVPDGCSTSSPTSSPCTASDVFRLNSIKHDFGNATVSLDLRNNYLTSSSRTPAEAWDGVHVWLHYQSEYNLYYASFNRRDGRIVIKKKCLGGSENGGTYYELGQGEVTGYAIPFGVWQHLAASIQDNADGSVTIAMYRDGVKLLAATDAGTGCAPIAAPGSVGIRGDNDNFNLDNFTVTPN